MEIEISEKTKRPLLGREELKATITFEGTTPKRVEVRDALAKKEKTKPELVVIRKIDNFYGKTKAEVSAFIYSEEKALKEVEKKYMVSRHEPKKAEGEEQQPAEAASKQPSGDAAEPAAEEKPEAPKEGSAEPAEKAEEPKEPSE